MSNLIEATLVREPFTSIIVLIYLGNVVWQLNHEEWGKALYWCAATAISITATWLMGWRG